MVGKKIATLILYSDDSQITQSEKNHTASEWKKTLHALKTGSSSWKKIVISY